MQEIDCKRMRAAEEYAKVGDAVALLDIVRQTICDLYAATHAVPQEENMSGPDLRYNVITGGYPTKTGYMAIEWGTRDYCIGFAEARGECFVACGATIVWPEDRWGEEAPAYE